MKVYKEFKTKLDNLDRIEIPKEYKESLKINGQEEVEILLDDETIIMKKIGRSCDFCNCNDERNLSKFKGKYICYNCYKELFERIHIAI